VQGKVHGGRQPISGASVYLYAAGTGGYGTASVLLSGPVTTASDGTFTIPSTYSCPSSTSQAYIYALGGNPGSGTNTAAGLLAGLGACSALSSSTYVTVNEVSTIATSYALAGYATDPTHVSSSGSALAQIGMVNAFATVTNLETLSTGVALATTPAANGTVPQSEINTLADILAGCINSSGPSSTPCSTLFGNAKNGSTAPTDTATAAINIAHNPGANVSTLWSLVAGSGTPFLPYLGGAPNDFTIAISYTGGGLNYSWGIAVDGSGNVWVANPGDNNDGDSISEFSPVGKPLSGSSGYAGGGLNGPEGIAVDPSGNIWVTNSNSGTTGTISEFKPSTSTWGSASGFSGGGLNSPVLLAIDASSNVWVTNGNNSISEFSSVGSPLSGSGFTGNGQLVEPGGIAIDTSGNVWVANSAWDTPSESSLSEFNSLGVANVSSPFTGSGLYQPEYVAIDASGNVWTADNDYSGSPPVHGGLSVFNSSGSAVSGTSGYSGGGLYSPIGLAIDGAGNAWVANADGNSVSEFSSTGTPITGTNGYGYDSGAFAGVAVLAIDGSGNIWLTNPEAAGTSANTLTELVGTAAPVATPMVANLLSPYGTKAVNKP